MWKEKIEREIAYVKRIIKFDWFPKDNKSQGKSMSNFEKKAQCKERYKEEYVKQKM